MAWHATYMEEFLMGVLKQEAEEFKSLKIKVW